MTIKHFVKWVVVLSTATLCFFDKVCLKDKFYLDKH